AAHDRAVAIGLAEIADPRAAGVAIRGDRARVADLLAAAGRANRDDDDREPHERAHPSGRFDPRQGGWVAWINHLMRAVVQRVTRASVTVGTRVTGAIDAGLLVLLGAGAGDGASDLAYIVDKIANLRIFADDAGKMNRSVLDVGGGVLVVSQFTLYGDARQGRRPGFTGALEPAAARALYDRALVALADAGVARVQGGEFAAHMAGAAGSAWGGPRP